MKGYALITGTTSGLGLEFAKIFLEEGHGIVISGRNEEKLKEIARELGGTGNVPVEYVVADLSEEGSAKKIYDEVSRRSLAIEYLVNNAGTQIFGEFAETDLEADRALLGVNLLSLVELCRYFIPDMKARKSGRILNIGSTGSFAPGPFNAIYCASKAFVLSFSEAIGEELTGSGVRVTTLCPGATRTKFAGKAGIEDTRLFRMHQMDAGKVARIGYDAMMKGRRTVVAGAINKAQTFLIRLSPRGMVVKISRALLSK